MHSVSNEIISLVQTCTTGGYWCPLLWGWTHIPALWRGQPCRTALFRRMLRAALTTACCPWLGCFLAVVCPRPGCLFTEALDNIASWTLGAMTVFHSWDIHLAREEQIHIWSQVFIKLDTKPDRQMWRYWIKTKNVSKAVPCLWSFGRKKGSFLIKKKKSSLV